MSKLFINLIKAELGIDLIEEYRFNPDRKWKSDYACLEHKILIEQEGGLYGNKIMGHSSSAGILRDVEKYNSATSLGWSVLRCTPKGLMTKDFIELIKLTIQNKDGSNKI